MSHSEMHARALGATNRGDYRIAARLFRRALHLAEASRPSDPAALASLLNDYGVACKYCGEFVRAQRFYRRALKLAAMVKNAAARNELLAALCHNLGGIAHSRRRYAEGLRHARRGVAIRKKIRPCDAVALAADEAAMAAILADSGRAAEAERTYLRSLRVFRRRLGPLDYEMGAALASLGVIHARRGSLTRAERNLQQGVSIIEKALGKRHPRSAIARRNLAAVSDKIRGERARYVE